MGNDKFTIDFDEVALGEFIKNLDIIRSRIELTQKAAETAQKKIPQFEFKFKGLDKLQQFFSVVSLYNPTQFGAFLLGLTTLQTVVRQGNFDSLDKMSKSLQEFKAIDTKVLVKISEALTKFVNSLALLDTTFQKSQGAIAALQAVTASIQGITVSSFAGASEGLAGLGRVLVEFSIIFQSITKLDVSKKRIEALLTLVSSLKRIGDAVKAANGLTPATAKPLIDGVTTFVSGLNSAFNTKAINYTELALKISGAVLVTFAFIGFLNALTPLIAISAGAAALLAGLGALAFSASMKGFVEGLAAIGKILGQGLFPVVGNFIKFSVLAPALLISLSFFSKIAGLINLLGAFAEIENSKFIKNLEGFAFAMKAISQALGGNRGPKQQGSATVEQVVDETGETVNNVRKLSNNGAIIFETLFTFGRAMANVVSVAFNIIKIGVIFPLLFGSLAIFFKLVGTVTSLIPGDEQFELLTKGFAKVGQTFIDINQALGGNRGPKSEAAKGLSEFVFTIGRGLTNLFSIAANVIKIGVLFPAMFASIALVFKLVSFTLGLIPDGGEFQRLTEGFKNLGKAFLNLGEAFGGNGGQGKTGATTGFVLGLLKFFVVIPAAFTALAIVFKTVSAVLSLIPGGDEFAKLSNSFVDLGSGMKKFATLGDLDKGQIDKAAKLLKVIAKAMKDITKDLLSLGIVEDFVKVAASFKDVGEGINSIADANKKINITDLLGIFVKMRVLGLAIKSVLDLKINADEATAFSAAIRNVGQGIRNIVRALDEAKVSKGTGILDIIFTIGKVKLIVSQLLGSVKGVKPETVLNAAKLYRSLGESLKDIFNALSTAQVKNQRVDNVASLKDKIGIVQDIFKAIGKFKNAELPDLSGFVKTIPEFFTFLEDLSKRDVKFSDLQNTLKGLVKVFNEIGKLKVNNNKIKAFKEISAFIKDIKTLAEDVKNIPDVNRKKKIDIAPQIDTTAANTKGVEAGQDIASGVEEGILRANLRQTIIGFFVKIAGSIASALNPVNLFSGLLGVTRSLGSFADNILQKYGELKTKLREIAGDLREMGENIREFGERLVNFGPQQIFGSQAFQSATEFDRLSTQVQVFGNLSDDALLQAQQFANEIGVRYPLSANEALNATLSLIKAGQELNAVEFILPNAADLAALSDSGSIETTTNILIAAQSQFSNFTDDVVGSFESINVATDLLARAANVSTASVESIGEGLANVGPAADAFGLTMEDTVAILALFDQNAIKGAEGGTALGSLLNALGSQRSQAALASLGVSLFEVNDAGQRVRRDFQDVINDLIVSLDGLDEAQRAAKLQQLADTYGRQGLQILLNAGVDGIDEIIAAMDGLPTAGEQALNLLDNLSGDVEQLTGSFETLLIRALLPLVDTVARPVVQALRLFVDSLLNLNDETLAFVSTAVALGSIFTGFVGSLLIAVGAVIQFGGAVLGVLALLASMATIGGAIVGGLVAFTAGLAGILVIAIPLITALGLITAVFRGLATSVNAAIERTKDGALAVTLRNLTSIGAAMGLIFRELSETFSFFFGTFENGEDRWTSFTDVVSNSIIRFSQVSDIFRQLAINVFGFTSAFNTFLTTGEVSGGALNNPLFRLLLGEVNSISIGALFRRLEEDFSQLRGAFVNLQIAAQQLINGLFTRDASRILSGQLRISSSLRQFASSITGVIGELFNLDTTAIEDAFETDSLAAGFQIIVGRIVSTIKSVLLDNRDVVISALTNFFSFFFIPGKFIGTLARVFGLDALAGIVDQYVSAARGLFEGLLNTVFNILEGQDIGTALRNAFGTNIDATLNFIESIANTIGNVIGLIQDVFSAFFLSPQQENQANRSTSLIDFVNNIINNAANVLNGLNAVIITPLRQFIQGVDFNAVKATISSLFTNLFEFFTNLGSGNLTSSFQNIANIGDILSNIFESIFGASQGGDNSGVARQIGISLVSILSAGVISAFGLLGAALGVNSGTIIEGLISAFQGVVNALNSGSGGEIFAAVGNAVLTALVSAIQLAIGGLSSITGLDFQATINSLDTALVALVSAVQSGSVGGAFSATANAIVGLLASAINFAIEGIGGLLNIDTSTLTTGIQSSLGEALSAIDNLFTGSETDPSVFENLANVFERLSQAISSLFASFSGSSVSSELESGGLPGPFQAILNLIAGISVFSLDTITFLADTLNTLFDTIGGLNATDLTLISIAIGAILLQFQGAAIAANMATLTTNFTNLYASLRPFIGLLAVVIIFRALGDAFSSFADAVSDFQSGNIASGFGNILEGILTFLASITEQVDQLTGGAITGLFGLLGIDFSADREQIVQLGRELGGLISRALFGIGFTIARFFDEQLALIAIRFREAQDVINFTGDDTELAAAKNFFNTQRDFSLASLGTIQAQGISIGLADDFAIVNQAEISRQVRAGIAGAIASGEPIPVNAQDVINLQNLGILDRTIEDALFNGQIDVAGALFGAGNFSQEEIQNFTDDILFAVEAGIISNAQGIDLLTAFNVVPSATLVGTDSRQVIIDQATALLTPVEATPVDVPVAINPVVPQDSRADVAAFEQLEAVATAQAQTASEELNRQAPVPLYVPYQVELVPAAKGAKELAAPEIQSGFTAEVTSQAEVETLTSDLAGLQTQATNTLATLQTLPELLQPAIDGLILLKDTAVVPTQTSFDLLFQTILLKTYLATAAIGVTSLTMAVGFASIRLSVDATTASFNNFSLSVQSVSNEGAAAINTFGSAVINNFEIMRQGAIVVIGQVQKLVKELQGASEAISGIGGQANAASGGSSGGTGTGTSSASNKFGGRINQGEITEFLEPGLPFEIFRSGGRTFMFTRQSGEFFSPANSQPFGGPANQARPSTSGSTNIIQVTEGGVEIQIITQAGQNAQEIARQVSTEVAKELNKRQQDFNRVLRTSGRK